MMTSLSVVVSSVGLCDSTKLTSLRSIELNTHSHFPSSHSSDRYWEFHLQITAYFVKWEGRQSKSELDLLVGIMRGYKRNSYRGDQNQWSKITQIIRYIKGINESMPRLNSSVALMVLIYHDLSDTELLIVFQITPKERTLRKFLAF